MELNREIGAATDHVATAIIAAIKGYKDTNTPPFGLDAEITRTLKKFAAEVIRLARQDDVTSEDDPPALS